MRPPVSAAPARAQGAPPYDGPRQIVLQRPQQVGEDGWWALPLAWQPQLPATSCHSGGALEPWKKMMSFINCGRGRRPSAGEHLSDLNFVGEGRGAYVKVPTLVYVGEGKGSFDPPEQDSSGAPTFDRLCPDTICGVNRAECFVRFCVAVMLLMLLLGIVSIAVSLAGGELLKEPQAASGGSTTVSAASNHTAEATDEVDIPAWRMAVVNR